VRVFVYEHVTHLARSGQPVPSSLRAEGLAMLTAVRSDLARCPGVEAVTLEPGGDFRRLARTCDRTLVIAPEAGGVLETYCRRVEEEGGRLLGPSSAAVRLTADKLALAAHLAGRGVPTPATRTARGEKCPFPFPVVVKPRDGAGSLATFLVRTEEEWKRRGETADTDGWRGELLAQPFVPGRAASVAVLVGPAGSLALPPAWQHLSDDGRFSYLGGSAPLPANLARRATRLAEQAVAAVAGMRGFVGVDLVLCEAPDGRGDAAVEINPRLTTSYVGLSELARDNLAEALLKVASGAAPPELCWRAGSVRWRPDGEVERG
jgi:predicted ATP-grasp superfamily ATP-dependent carboligase